MSENWDKMSHEARELYLFIENDAALYRQMHVPIMKNYMRKRKKGIFDKELAVKGFMHLVDEGARRYNKEYGTGTAGIPGFFSKSVRLEVAREFTERFIAEADLGNYDDLLKKESFPGPGVVSNPRVGTAAWKLTFVGDGKTITEIIDVIGGHAEALEEANNFLNAGYYKWEIISLEPFGHGAARNPRSYFAWAGRGRDLPEDVFLHLNESYPISDNTPIALKIATDGAIEIWYGEPIIENGFMTDKFRPVGLAYAAEPEEKIFASLKKMTGFGETHLVYEINPSYWNVPLLIQDLRAMGVKFKVIERGKLRTDLIPLNEQEYHRIYDIHYNSGRDYRRIGAKSFSKRNPRPKIDRSAWKEVISSAPPYFTADGFVLFHDEHGNRNKAAMADFEDITSAEDKTHGQFRFRVKNIKGKTTPKHRMADHRRADHRKHNPHRIKTFPMRRGGQKALKKELTKKFGRERQVVCPHCKVSYTVRWKGSGQRPPRTVRNCPQCGQLIEIKG